jgi:hypothetical protein
MTGVARTVASGSRKMAATCMALPAAGLLFATPACADGYQFVRTASGQVRCGVAVSEVGCERTAGEGFLNAPTSGRPAGWHWNLAIVNSGGGFRWDVGNVGGAYIDQDLVMGYGQAYNINGWTIQTSTGGTRFTKNSTGRGMFVSIESTYPF